MPDAFGNGLKNRLLWVDLETTGLDEDKDVILEVGVICTDWNLVEIAQFESLVQLSGWLPSMRPDAFKMHASSGLLMEVATLAKYKIEVVDDAVAAFIGEYNGPMAGATPSFDKKFMKKFMPNALACFDHRLFDVSTLKQSYRMWEGDWPKEPLGHRVLADIRSSIEECKRFKTWCFRQL